MKTWVGDVPGGAAVSTCCPPLTPPSNGSWAQPAWWIDPANSTGLASDANSGADATHPVLTWKNGVLARYGTLSPVLRQDTTWHWMSSQADDTDPVVFYPFIVHGAKLLMTGANGLTTLASTTLATVTAKNRATPQLLQADIGASGAAGVLVHNTTLGSKAWAYLNISGHVWSLTQPLADGTPFGFVTTEDNGWVNPNAVTLLAPPKINIVDIRPVLVDYNGAFTNYMVLYELNILDPTGAGNDDTIIGNYVHLIECAFQREILFSQESPTDVIGTSVVVNCYMPEGVSGGPGTGPTTGTDFQAGVILFSVATSFALKGPQFSSDIILDAPNGNTGLFVYDGTFNHCYIGSVLGLHLCDNAQFVLTATLWGPGAFDGFARCRVVVTGATAAASLLCTGQITLNGLSTASAVDQGVDPSAWHSGRTITPANLDAAIAAGGFGNGAVNPFGACIVVIPPT